MKCKEKSGDPSIIIGASAAGFHPIVPLLYFYILYKYWRSSTRTRPLLLEPYTQALTVHKTIYLNAIDDRSKKKTACSGGSALPSSNPLSLSAFNFLPFLVSTCVAACALTTALMILWFAVSHGLMERVTAPPPLIRRRRLRSRSARGISTSSSSSTSASTSSSLVSTSSSC